MAMLDIFEWGANGDPIYGSGGGITWTSLDTAIISTAQAYQGTRSMMLDAPGAVRPEAQFALTATGAPAAYAIEFWLYKPDAAADIENVLQHGNGTRRIYLRVDSSENVLYYDSDLPGYVDTGANVTADAWTEIKLQNINWATYKWDIYVAGSLAKAGAGMVTSTIFANIVCFSGSTTNGEDIWIDNVIVKNWPPKPQIMIF